MRLEISELHHQLKTTMIYVTHDQVEAMTMADKIVVLNAGNIEQVGSPLDLYQQARQPVRRRLHRLAAHELRQGRGGETVRRAIPIGIRPEHHKTLQGGRQLEGCTVGVAEHLGSDTFLHVNVEGIGIDDRARRRRLPRHARRYQVWLTPEHDTHPSSSMTTDWQSDEDGLTGKSALITGSARGIGRAFAESYVREGATGCDCRYQSGAGQNATAQRDRPGSLCRRRWM